MENKTGIQLIAEERQRQIEVEGYNVYNDVESYQNGQLIGAAGCYAANAINKAHGEDVTRFQIRPHNDEDFIDAWPWALEYDKRAKHDVLRSLTIAGALIAAEIDRIQSLKNQQP